MKILLGVSGGIAAYKSANLVREFVKRGDEVRAVMTAGAQEFISPLTLQVLTENRVGTETFDASYESEIGHIDLARWADVVLLAPATANLIAKMAAGTADDLLTTVLLATTAPVVVAPAMNTQMWRHPTVQRNVETLRDEIGYHVITPDAGELACKEIGPGRLPDPPVLLDAVDSVTAPKILDGQKVLVTAGPTREHIDPARFISNPSTGRMGYALARAAARFGADVTLVTGPTDIDAPPNVRVIGVVSARQMFDVVCDEAPEMDMICKAAAVADWRPIHQHEQKNTKSDMSTELELEKTPDILATLGEKYGPGTDGDGAQGNGPFLVGFAAETHDVVERGKDKRDRKNAHVIVANRIGGERSAFGADQNTIAVITEQDVHEYGPDSKDKLSEEIWRVVAEARRHGEQAR
jgi:phosphopantothenoylcysteine decarboxylase/phosphopantothenate--cysteine ligase